MEPEGDWSGPSGDDAEAGFPESPVIAIDEPVKVFLQLGRGYSVKGTEQKGLRFAMAVCTFGSHSSTFSADMVRDSTSNSSSRFIMPAVATHDQ